MLRRCFLSALLTALPVAMVGDLHPAKAQDDAPDPDDLRSGLVAAFAPLQGDGRPRPSVVRLAPSPVERWDAGAPDPRFPPGPFSGNWSGWLHVREGGAHRFLVESDGAVAIHLDGRPVLSAEGGRSRSDPVELRPGLVDLRIDYRRGEGNARMAVGWEGPGFGVEQIPPHQLYHEAARSPSVDLFEQGRRLADRLGCASCHEVLGLPGHPELGPPLERSRSLRPGWLVDWLADPPSTRPGTPMPGFALDRTEAADLAAFLRAASTDDSKPDREARMALNVADSGRGRLLFRSAGCLGCHPRPESPEPALARLAPDLSGLGRKRSAEAVALYLGGATKTDTGRHRPSLGLSAEAAAHLAAYLTTGPTPGNGTQDDVIPPGDPERGRQLVSSVGCVACHAIPGVDRRVEAPSLSHSSDPRSGCLADVPPGGVPHYAIDDEQRTMLRAFVDAIPEHPSPLSPWTLAEDAIRRRNCLGCHSRYGQGGEAIGARLASLLAEDRELNTLKGTMSPPDLSSVGAKLLPEYLDLAVTGQAPTARPWLSVRMPRYAFEPGEAGAIASYLREFDRVEGAQTYGDPSPSMGKEAGIALLGRDGFGCVSCHVIQGRIPPGGEPETLGPDLALAHRRMSRSYYDRWITDPQRIIPGTPMPQFLVPATGIGGTLAEQLGAVWDALGDERLAELTSTATRQFLERQGDRAMVVRDMILPPDAPAEYYPRGLAIGLHGDRSLLFDTDRLAWIRWWDGGFLYRTKQGRLWEWHPQGRTIWSADEALPPVIFRGRDKRLIQPEEERERFGSFAELAFDGDAVRLRYVLNGPDGVSIPVDERISPTADGWERLVTIRDVPEGLAPHVVAASGATTADGGPSRWNAGAATIVLPVEAAEPTLVRMMRDALLVPATSKGGGAWSCRFQVEVSPGGE